MDEVSSIPKVKVDWAIFHQKKQHFLFTNTLSTFFLTLPVKIFFVFFFKEKSTPLEQPLLESIRWLRHLSGPWEVVYGHQSRHISINWRQSPSRVHQRMQILYIFGRHTNHLSSLDRQLLRAGRLKVIQNSCWNVIGPVLRISACKCTKIIAQFFKSKIHLFLATFGTTFRHFRKKWPIFCGNRDYNVKCLKIGSTLNCYYLVQETNIVENLYICNTISPTSSDSHSLFLPYFIFRICKYAVNQQRK